MRLSQETRILNILLNAKGRLVGMRKLNSVAFRYNSRIFDLRRKGYDIETIQLGLGHFAYRLINKLKK
jgi:hypothetical protein